MSDHVPTADDLVMTEAEAVPPPDVTVPEPAGEGCRPDPQVLLEIKQLADRVGGLEALRGLVDALVRIQDGD